MASASVVAGWPMLRATSDSGAPDAAETEDVPSFDTRALDVAMDVPAPPFDSSSADATDAFDAPGLTDVKVTPVLGRIEVSTVGGQS